MKNLNDSILIDMDKRLWNQLKSGNVEAFGALYDVHADFLYGYGMKIMNNDVLVSDLIQNLFLYIFEKKENLSDPVSVRAYLCTSLKHMAFRQLEKESRNRIVSFDTINEYDFELDIDIETALIQHELEEEYLLKLQKALDALSPQQREVIYLKYYKGFTNDEIAEVLEVSNQVVRNISSRALIRLREVGNIKSVMLLIIV